MLNFGLLGEIRWYVTYLTGAGTPQVDAGSQTNTEHIQRGPVH